MILSPRRGGVDVGGRTDSWVDHFRVGRGGSEAMADGRGGIQKLRLRDIAYCMMVKSIMDP